MLKSLNFIHNDRNLKKALEIEKSSLNYIKILNQEKMTRINMFRCEIKDRQKEPDFSLNNQFHEKLIRELQCISAKVSGRTRIVKSTLAYYVIGELIQQNKKALESINETSFISFSKFLFDFSPSLKTLNKMGVGTNKSTYTFNENDYHKEKNSVYILWFHNEYQSFKDRALLCLMESRDELTSLKKDLKKELVELKIYKNLPLLVNKKKKPNFSYY